MNIGVRVAVAYYILKRSLQKHDFELKYQAYNKTNAFDMLPKPPEEFCEENKSKFYRKDHHCKWYNFSLFDSIMNKLNTLLDRC